MSSILKSHRFGIDRVCTSIRGEGSFFDLPHNPTFCQAAKDEAIRLCQARQANPLKSFAAYSALLILLTMLWARLILQGLSYRTMSFNRPHTLDVIASHKKELKQLSFDHRYAPAMRQTS